MQAIKLLLLLLQPQQSVVSSSHLTWFSRCCVPLLSLLSLSLSLSMLVNHQITGSSHSPLFSSHTVSRAVLEWRIREMMLRCNCVETQH